MTPPKAKQYHKVKQPVVYLKDINSSVSSTPTPRPYTGMLKQNPTKRSQVEVPFEPITPQANIEFSSELKKVINERNILTSKTRKRVFDALDDITKKNDEETRHFKREKALLEIINSEIKYVHQLEVIINYFLKPTQHGKLLKPDDFQILFGNINTIYNINKELLDELDKGADNIANAFSKIAPFLKLYSVYAYEFKNILQMIQNLRVLHPQFAKFVENQESRPEVQSKLSALLITPIQRVPRYKLLLTHLLELTLPTEEGYQNLSDCLERVHDAAEHINKIVDDYENMQHLLELQRRLRNGEPNIIKPGRKLIKEGVLVKMSTKEGPSEKVYTVLMNDLIMFNRMKKEEPRLCSLKCLGIFPLSKCKVVEMLDKGCFRISCLEEERTLYHDQFCETKKWIAQIKDAIENHLCDRRTLRKDSSSRRPVKRKDLHEYHEVGLSPGRPLKKRKMENETDPVKPKISRRRPIHGNLFGSSLNADQGQEDVSESLFDTPNNILTKENVEAKQPTKMSNELFVFGRQHNHDNFNFGKFLGGVSSSIKRFLGFKHS